MGWNKDTEYFSGQGVLLVGLRSATGKPLGLRHIGNCPELSIKIAQNTEEHKESQSGNSSTDLSIVRSTEVTTSAKIEDFEADNLALLLQAAIKPVSAGTVTTAPIYVSRGAISPLDHLRVSDVVISVGGTALVEYTEGAADDAYDFEVNADAGSIKFNSKSPKTGINVTALTVGAVTGLTVVAPAAVVGSTINLNGFTGADAALVNGKTFKVVSNTGTQITIGLVTTGKEVSGGAGATLSHEGMVAEVSYTHEAFTEVEALTQNKVDLFWRFEGLNSASENYDPVVVEMFKVSSKPLQDLALISDTIQSSTIEASLLADTNRARKNEKSAYFIVRKIGKNQ